MAGQVVMQGFIRRRIPIFLRRAITLAPALLVLAIGVDPTDALVGSQVVLSFGIPFALVPLLIIASKREVMGELVNPRWLTALAGRRGADHRPQRLPNRRLIRLADQPIHELGQFSCHAGAGDHQVDAGSFRSLLGLGVYVGVEAEGWHLGLRDFIGIHRVEVANEQVSFDGIRQALHDSDIVPRAAASSPRPCWPASNRRRWPGLEPLDRAALAELLADALRPSPHLHDLGPSLAHLANLHLADHAIRIELLQNPRDALGGSSMPKAVRNEQPPMPISFRVGLRIDLTQGHGAVHVPTLVVDPQIKLQIRPIGRKRIENLPKISR